MIKVEHIETYGIAAAIRGMRNPMNSWEKSDSVCNMIGPSDLELCRKLYLAGPEHRKFMRQITCSMDVVAPLYWWKQLDTYKYIVSDSCSTMHKLMSRDLTLQDFSYNYAILECLKDDIKVLNRIRERYCNTSDPDMKQQYFQGMVQLLPSGYNQRRTITMNYETAANIIRQRENHKLPEWHEFCRVLRNLVWLGEIMGGETDGSENNH